MPKFGKLADLEANFSLKEKRNNLSEEISNFYDRVFDSLIKLRSLLQDHKALKKLFVDVP